MARESDPVATILMIDDNAALLDLYKELLNDDFHVLTACSIAEATELLAGRQVDAVGCDYHLSDGCGLDVVAWIATHCPDLLQTTALISGVERPPLHGFNVTCLYKPVPIDKLLELFSAWLSPNYGDSSHVTHSA